MTNENDLIKAFETIEKYCAERDCTNCIFQEWNNTNDCNFVIAKKYLEGKRGE